MSLIRRKTATPITERLMTLQEATEILGLDESTIRKGGAGTAHLTKVRLGDSRRAPVRLVRSEVEAFIRDLIDDGRARNEAGPRRVWAGVISNAQKEGGHR
jgi:predicted DNA-binding transcriptional regulator AlpA